MTKLELVQHILSHLRALDDLLDDLPMAALRLPWAINFSSDGALNDERP